jgi:hypothetical protein
MLSSRSQSGLQNRVGWLHSGLQAVLSTEVWTKLAKSLATPAQ